MKNILKLTGVSILAVMATANANAAGYTCEELIEYTSCNAGYYLYTPTSSGCPEGYTYNTSYCFNYDTGYYPDVSQSECLEGDDGSNVYLGRGCADTMESPNDPYEYFIPATTSCLECPVGSICSGGTESATPCPAGSYCATAGLSTPTGLCPKGTFSAGGATSASCTACPTSDLTDANGNVVSVITASTGSISSAACFVAKGTEFKDDKGTYRYTDDCKYGSFSLKNIKTETDCEEFSEATGEGWRWDGSICVYDGNDTVLVPTTQEKCEAANGEWVDPLDPDYAHLDGPAYCECMTWGIRDGVLNCEI